MYNQLATSTGGKANLAPIAAGKTEPLLPDDVGTLPAPAPDWPNPIHHT
jgi:hypothetical protein